MVGSRAAYTAFLGLVGAERLAELALTRRNTAWSLARGGVEVGRRHYPVMVAMHTALFGACLAEVARLDRRFRPHLGWPMVGLVAGTEALRWWAITTLGPRWNTRVIVIPGLEPVRGGPYRFLRHPNYVAVVLEVAALPLVHSAWLTAGVFSALNAAVLRVRIRVEDAALDAAAAGRRP